jgi:ketosteroid isomerase-like protein
MWSISTLPARCARLRIGDPHPALTAEGPHWCQDRAMGNREIVESFWDALYARDWDRIAAHFASDAEYTDVCSPADDIAIGPEQVVARLRLGIEPIDGYDHEQRLVIAEGVVVVTEHSETWRWHTGEEVTLPFVSVHELRDGQIVRWYDYWDLQTLLGAAPSWWIEHIMVGWKDERGS